MIIVTVTRAERGAILLRPLCSCVSGHQGAFVSGERMRRRQGGRVGSSIGPRARTRSTPRSSNTQCDHSCEDHDRERPDGGHR